MRKAKAKRATVEREAMAWRETTDAMSVWQFFSQRTWRPAHRRTGRRCADTSVDKTQWLQRLSDRLARTWTPALLRFFRSATGDRGLCHGQEA